MIGLTVKEELYLMDKEQQSVSENEITANLAYINVFENFLQQLERNFQHVTMPNYIYHDPEKGADSMKKLKSLLASSNVPEIRRVLKKILTAYSDELSFWYTFNKNEKPKRSSIEFSKDDEVQESLGLVFFMLFGD